jgi:hypothetical protein
MRVEDWPCDVDMGLSAGHAELRVAGEAALWR